MKSLRCLCAAIALILTLTLTTFAGEISTGVVVTPPPPPPQASVMGDVMDAPFDTDEASNGATSISPFGEIGLSLLRSVLTLF